MYNAETAFIKAEQKSENLNFKRFELKDRNLIQTFVDKYLPWSCEYNFSNLFTWQDAYKMSWTLYQERLLIYDGLSQYAFMPLGEEFCPEELAILSLNLKNAGFAPNFYLVPPDYLEKFPNVKNYYTVEEERDSAEYIYDVENLSKLTGSKLHKKRNLISQFNRAFPDFTVHALKGEYKEKAMEFARELMTRNKEISSTLDKEFAAIQLSFDSFEELGLEGIAIMVEDKMAAFCVFSQLTPSTYDIQFEKADMNFKGAAQVINQETAKYLQAKCQYLNREQDLGVKGLRQAKMSYEPVELITPSSLIYTPLN